MAKFSTLDLFALAIVSFLVYSAALVIYRLYFHPLAKFPGSKLAAATLWYEFYFDVIQKGKFLWKVKEMHEKYGPIIRLNPSEIHINDPEYFDEIYTNAPRKRDKYQWWVNTASAHESGFSTISHDLHRQRRGVLNPFFSKRSINQLEPVLRSKIEKLSDRFEKLAGTGAIVRLDVAFIALTTDLISDYAFGEDPHYLDADDFMLEWKETIMGGFQTGATMRHFPFILPIVKALPPKLVAALNPQIGFLMRRQDNATRNVLAIKSQTPEQEKASGKPRTMFHTLRDCDLPDSEKSVQRFCDEAEVVVGAGSETTAACLSRTWFYLLSNPSLLVKLREELAIVMPTPYTQVPTSTLEALPYLSAVIYEGVRLSYGVTTRIPRIAPTEVLTYKGYTIPPGTPVSETIPLILLNPTVFPDPETFDPERWIKNKRLDRFLVAFGKGSRNCMGMNLAYAEMYLTFSTLLARFDYELYETTRERDVVISHDFFVASPDLNSKGIRVRVKKREA